MELKHVKIRTALLIILLVFSGVLILTSINAWLSARDAYRALTELNRTTEQQTVPVTNTLITVLRARLAVIGAQAEYQNGNLADARHSHEASQRFAREAAASFQTFVRAQKSAAAGAIAERMQARFELFRQAMLELNRALESGDRSAFLKANLKARESSEGYYASLAGAAETHRGRTSPAYAAGAAHL